MPVATVKATSSSLDTNFGTAELTAEASIVATGSSFQDLIATATTGIRGVATLTAMATILAVTVTNPTTLLAAASVVAVGTTQKLDVSTLQATAQIIASALETALLNAVGRPGDLWTTAATPSINSTVATPTKNSTIPRMVYP